MSKELILGYMHNLVCRNIIGSKQYNSRYNGFNGELHFSQWCRANKPNLIAPGGLFIPLVKTENSFQEAIYILITPRQRCDFVEEQLTLASKLATRGVYFITYDLAEPIESWNHMTFGDFNVPFPSTLQIFKFSIEESGPEFTPIEFLQFSTFTGLNPHFPRLAPLDESLILKHKEKLSQYEYEDIVELYMSRFALDCLCSLYGIEGKQRGAPLDIDFFVKGNDDRWLIFEVKEKNLSKNDCFGMDLRRISSLLLLSETFKMNAGYVVRQIADQEEREFVDWKIINIKKFNAYASKFPVQGGFGMGPENGYNPTRLCKENYFRSLTEAR